VTDTLARLQVGLQGAYQIEEEIGRGGMAVVYRARDLRHDRAVAIKVLREEIGAAVGSERFLQEIRIESRLQHPHILPLHDSGVVDGLPYYVMPYVEGESLRDRLTREGQLAVDEAMRIAREVGDALYYAHTQGLVHRDIKPENILLSSGHAIVADFGIAQALSEAGGARLTATGIVIGTPAYMSPEQAGGAVRIDARSDVYSLGCVLYEMLVGEPPFGGRTAQAVLARHIQERPPSIEVVRPDVPHHILLAVERALAKAPADRYATAADFVGALSSERRTAGPARRRSAGRRWRAMALAATVSAAAIGGVWWVVFRPRPRPPDPNRIVVFPLLERGLGIADSGLGLDVAILIGTALEGTDPLKWIDGWSHLDTAVRNHPERLTAGDARRITLERGARYFIDGVVQGASDSMVVALRAYDAAGDSLLARSSARDAVGSAPAYRLGLMATTRLLPAVVGSTPGLDPTHLLARSPAAAALFVQGERAYRNADFGPALEFYQRAVADDSLLVPAAMKGAQAAGWQHRTRDAEVLIGFAVRHDSLLPARHGMLARGLASYLTGDADSAMMWIGRAVDADSAWSEAHMALGEVAQHLLPRDRDSLPQVAERAFHAVLALDSAFAPALYHVAQHALLRGDLAEAGRLVARLQEAGADTTLLSELELAQLCVRDGPAKTPWTTVVPADAQRAAKLLATGGAYLDCAQAGFRAVYHSPFAQAERWGALLGLNGVLAARGRWTELRGLLDSAVAGGLTQGLLLYMLDTFAGAPFDTEAARGEVFARQLFGDAYQGASSQSLWFLGTWFVHLGDQRRAGTVLDSLGARVAAGGSRARAALREGLAAQIALARGDTNEALRRLRAVAPAAGPEALGYDLTAGLQEEHMLLARLEAAQGEFARAHRVAALFDGGSIANLPFLPASLRIREHAAERLQRSDLSDQYRARLRALGWPTVAVQ
jgi:serine/threonine-protein kinase